MGSGGTDGDGGEGESDDGEGASDVEDGQGHLPAARYTISHFRSVLEPFRTFVVLITGYVSDGLQPGHSRLEKCLFFKKRPFIKVTRDLSLTGVLVTKTQYVGGS